MSSPDHLRAAARCWERAGFYENAAERFTIAKAWHDAGRCFSQAERHNDAALSYSRAAAPLLEAREHLMGRWPEQARLLYVRLGSGPFDFPSAQVEALLGLGEIDEATRVALTSSDREAVTMLDRLTAERGRPDLAASLWSRVAEPSWENFTPWNRTVHRQHLPMVAEPKRSWPSIDFSGVALVPIWEEQVGEYRWGDRALDWSADSRFFAAAVNSKGLTRGFVDPAGVQLECWKSLNTNCARFVPGRHAVLTDHTGGKIQLVSQAGSIHEMEPLRLPAIVWSIAFSPQGDRVALAAWTKGEVGQLKVVGWECGHSGAEIEKIQESATWPHCAWSPDGLRLIWAPNSGLGKLIILAREGRQEILNAHRSNIESLAYSPDSRFLITGSNDRTVILRNGCNGQSLAPPERFADSVFSSSVHPHAALIAVGEGKRLHLLHLYSGEVPRLSRLSEQTLDESVCSLAFSPDGQYLLMMTGGEFPTTGHLHLFRVDLKP